MLTEGMFLVDRYEILSKVGAGGMSDVYKAKDHILGRVVAIKVLKAEYSEDVNFVTKFRTEAQSAAGLEHPNIVNIYDVGSENGMHFIVMEHVEGITLKTYIEKKGQLTFKEATSIAIQVARGIEAAHNKEIIHRDIKPQNIIISTEGKVKVTDFGIARAVSANTISADAMGSVHYASPEQARNGFVDGRSDIYSLGIVMYEMVTGRVPFDGDTTVSVALQHLQEEMVEPSAFALDLPVSYEKIVLKTTQKSPDRRYQDIAELLVDLRKALVTPDEDFVVITPVLSSKTRVISEDEVGVLRTTAEGMDLEKETGFAVGEEEYEEEEEDATGFLDPKTEKIVTVVGIAVLVVIVGIVLYLLGSIIGLFNFGESNTPSPKPDSQTESQIDSETESEDDESKVPMIKVVGMQSDAGKSALEAIGLKMNIVAYDSDSDQPDGTILDQSEPEGEMIQKGTTILVVVAGENANEEVKMVEVPTVVGATEEDAVNKLQNKNFLVTKEYEISETVEKGKVISQDPEGGEEAKEGSRITIVISLGKGSAKVPTDLVGKSYEEVKQILEDLGFVVDMKLEANDAEDGIVFKVDGSGEEKEVGSTIAIYVSTGPEEVEVPSVVGKTESEAVSALEAKGFKVTKEYQNSATVEKDKVISQSPAGGSGAKKGATITIVISLGKGTVKVPTGLVGKSYDEVKQILEELGFVVDVRREANNADDGVVFKVDGMGEEKEPGSTVVVYVSTGPEETEDTEDTEDTETPTGPEDTQEEDTQEENTQA